MKKALFSLVLSSIFCLASSASASAATASCQPIYGGGETCIQVGNVAVNKRVVDPKTNVLVDNLGINDNKFAPESVVTFQIAVTNTGNTKINTVQIRDIFPPQFVDFASGVGNFDANSKILAFDISDLNPSETRTFNLIGKVVKANQLPVDRGIMCVVNQATAKDAASTSEPSRDSSQLCIEKNQVIVTQPGITVVQPGVTVIPSETKGGLKVFPPQKVFTTPSTGPEMLPLIALLPTGAFGAFLRKKARFDARRAIGR